MGREPGVAKRVIRLQCRSNSCEGERNESKTEGKTFTLHCSSKEVWEADVESSSFSLPSGKLHFSGTGLPYIPDELSHYNVINIQSVFTFHISPDFTFCLNQGSLLY